MCFGLIGITSCFRAPATNIDYYNTDVRIISVGILTRTSSVLYALSAKKWQNVISKVIGKHSDCVKNVKNGRNIENVAMQNLSVGPISDSSRNIMLHCGYEDTEKTNVGWYAG